MPTDRKYPTVWESLHPGEPLPTDEEFRAMRERSYAYFDRKLREDPSYLDVYKRSCDCCAAQGQDGDTGAVSD